jgi:hypothetical protein
MYLVSITFGILYSILKYIITTLSSHKKNGHGVDALAIFIAIKIIVSWSLFEWMMSQNHASEIESILTLQMINYTIADLAILWKENIAMLIFGIGHAAFLTIFTIEELAHVMLDKVYVSGMIILPLLIMYHMPLKYKYPQTSIIEHAVLWIYMILLYLMLVVPIYHWDHYGVILFVISDLFIVFQWRLAWIIEYVFYVTSMVYLYVSIPDTCRVTS